MSRQAREKVTNKDAWYLVSGKTNRDFGGGIFEPKAVRLMFGKTVRFYESIYYCEVTDLSIGDTSYKMVIHFDKPKRLTKAKLREVTDKTHTSEQGRSIVSRYTKENWDNLNQRLFDISEFMRNIHTGVAKKYKKIMSINDPITFWHERFHSVILKNKEEIEDAKKKVREHQKEYKASKKKKPAGAKKASPATKAKSKKKKK